MNKKTQSHANQPVPSTEEVNAVVGDMSPETANVLSIRPGKASRQGIFDTINVSMTESVANKSQLLSQARQQLAMAADLSKQGESHAAEAKEASDNAAKTLLKLRVDGVVVADEVTAILGDTFGFKPKKDGTAGSTPAGMGEVTRKRIVRLFNAWDYVANNSDDRFYQGLPKPDVKSVVETTINGAGSIFTAYDQLAELRKNTITRVEPAFDWKNINKIVDSLAGQGAIDQIRGNNVLIASYAALWRMLGVINQELAEPETEAAE